MARRRRLTGDPVLDDVVHEVQGSLLNAVAETIASGSPEPARTRIAVIVGIDDEVTDSGSPPGQTLALVSLMRWLTGSARDEDVRPEPDEVLDWIGEHMGARYRARARYLIGALDTDGAHEAVSVYAEALGDDFLPALVWIAAALTALYGQGDPAWLVDEPAAAR